jgi:small GTP-binding protein
LIENTADEKLLEAYQSIRRREHKLIHDLLPILSKIDTLDEERVNQVRDAMFHTDHPYLMVLVGPFNAGKSSLVNALMGSNDLLKIGATPTTDSIQILRWGEEAERMESGGEVDTVFYPSPLLQKVSLVDTPGLESVFKSHEQTTRKFLHRADVVLLIMMATQAMTANNLETIQMFKEYGKKVIIVVNQCDLLSETERQEIEEFVRSESKSKLGVQPEIWMLSAKQGFAAHQADGTRDEIAWEASGMQTIESYINQQLGDANRLRQKLQTPLQIVQNVHGKALDAVKENQSALDHYQSINENIDAQLVAQRRGQDKTIRELNADIESQFQEISSRSQVALLEIFKLTRAIQSLIGGVFQLVGLTRIFGGLRNTSHVEKAFKLHDVFLPMDDIAKIVDKIGPRLEGQDMQDIDDLVKYGQAEITKLPTDLKDKVIGNIQAPVKYVRDHIQKLDEQLEPIEQSARKLEVQQLEDALRNTLLYLAAWQLIVFTLLFAFSQLSSGIEDDGLRLLILIVLPLSALMGFLMLPIRGRMIHTQFANRLNTLSQQYQNTVSTASEKQIDYGIQLRKDTIAPLTRLIEAQTSIHKDQLESLRSSEQVIVSIESDLNSLGKRKLLGVTL